MKVIAYLHLSILKNNDPTPFTKTQKDVAPAYCAEMD